MGFNSFKYYKYCLEIYKVKTYQKKLYFLLRRYLKIKIGIHHDLKLYNI